MVTFTFIIFSIIERKRVSEENHVNLSAKLNFSAKGVPVVVKIELSLSDFHPSIRLFLLLRRRWCTGFEKLSSQSRCVCVFFYHYFCYRTSADDPVI